MNRSMKNYKFDIIAADYFKFYDLIRLLPELWMSYFCTRSVTLGYFDFEGYPWRQQLSTGVYCSSIYTKLLSHLLTVLFLVIK